MIKKVKYFRLFLDYFLRNVNGFFVIMVYLVYKDIY